MLKKLFGSQIRVDLLNLFLIHQGEEFYVRQRQLAGVFSDTGAKLGREINYSVFSISEIEQRLQVHDHFFTSILKEPMLFIIGQEHEFRRMAQAAANAI